MSFLPGENVGPYRIIEQLGQGGMANVFKAYHPILDRYVAIKVLHPALKLDPNFISRFEREARIVAKLDHPNIVPIYDFAEHEGTPYLVIRYVEGETLRSLLGQGPLPLDRVLEILRPVAEALEYAHSEGILHRDIKPSNIILSNDGHIYLADFGLARMAQQTDDASLSQDMLIGTPQYISPEQAKGGEVDGRSDIYSLGVVLFEMLTGRVPFVADTPYAVIHDHIYSPLPLPTSINPKLSADLERALLKALAKEPDARYANSMELLKAIEETRTRTIAAPRRALAPVPRAVSTPGRAKPTGHTFPLRTLLFVTDALLILILVASILLDAQMIPRNVAYIAQLFNPEPAATSAPAVVVMASPISVVAIEPTTTVTFTPTATATASETATRTSSPSPTWTASATRSPLPTSTPTASPTRTASPTSTEKPTRTPSPTATDVPTRPPSPTAVPTQTPAPTATPLPTSTVAVPTPVPPTPAPTQTAVTAPGMVLIPEGVFWMGKNDTDPNATADEAPGHYVDLSAYYMDQYEVTNAQYNKCVDAGICPTPAGIFSAQTPDFAYGNPNFDAYPVVFVSQGNASRYCTWQGKALPTEAQWEKAARGAFDRRIYPWGDVWDGYRANVAQGKPGPLAATSYSPEGCSPFGACNMVGNVSEWVADYYWNTFYTDSMRAAPPSTPLHNPVNWNASGGKFSFRGGAYNSIPQNARVSKRNSGADNLVLPEIGFRCAKSAD